MFSHAEVGGFETWYQEVGLMPARKRREPGEPTVNRNVNGTHWDAFAIGAADVGVRWRDVDAARIGECIQAVCAIGDALLFGVVSGGGALAITICSGDRRIKRYARTLQEAEELLAEIENVASDLGH